MEPARIISMRTQETRLDAVNNVISGHLLAVGL